MGIKSPTGKDRWSKKSIENILSNRKYTGNVELLKEDENSAYFLAENNNSIIISEEIFFAVHRMRKQRSNMVIGEAGTALRKDTKYSFKKF